MEKKNELTIEVHTETKELDEAIEKAKVLKDRLIEIDAYMDLLNAKSGAFEQHKGGFLEAVKAYFTRYWKVIAVSAVITVVVHRVIG